MVTIDIELETEKDLSLDIEFLQFIGLTDHRKLTNRDVENQHPMGAIDGLIEFVNSENEKFQDINSSFQSMNSNFQDVFEKFQSVDKTLASANKQFDSISTHIEATDTQLQTMTEGLSNTNTNVREINNTVTTQGEDIETLKTFSSNIATEKEIEEVLAHE